MRYVFIGGEHHGGTSLASALLGDNQPGVAALRESEITFENEGQHLQNVWPAYRDRKLQNCQPFPRSVCLPTLRRALSVAGANATSLITSAWAHFWQCNVEPCAWRVEKDPDVGSLLLKAVVFPSATILAVMRHPFALAPYDGYDHTNRTTARDALVRWNAVWPFFMEHVAQLQRPYAVVRFEALGDPSAPAKLLALSGYEQTWARRRLGLHGTFDHFQISPALLWGWVNGSWPLTTHPISGACEQTFRELTGYSLQHPVKDSARGLLICGSSNVACSSSQVMSLAVRLEGHLGAQDFSRQVLWVSQQVMRAFVTEQKPGVV